MLQEGINTPDEGGDGDVPEPEVEEEARAEEIQKLAASVRADETLRAANAKNAKRSESSTVILHLAPGPVLVAEEARVTQSAVNNKHAKQSRVTGQNKQAAVTKKDANNKPSPAKPSASVAKTRPGKTKIAGKSVDFNSEKAQYLHLTMDQIQELAIKQRGGEVETSVQAGPEHEGGSAGPGHPACPLHNGGEAGGKSKKAGVEGSKFNTLPRQRRAKQELSQSPDLVKEAEVATNQASKKSTKGVGRSRSFNAKTATERRLTRPPAETADTAARRTEARAARGGLFAPTQNWLNYLQQGQDRRTATAASQEKVSRSSSSSRRSADTERSVSPRRRVRQDHTSVDIYIRGCI